MNGSHRWFDSEGKRSAVRVSRKRHSVFRGLPRESNAADYAFRAKRGINAILAYEDYRRRCC
eukprot:2971945-Pyramimonas_sp.AAC.1